MYVRILLVRRPASRRAWIEIYETLVPFSDHPVALLRAGRGLKCRRRFAVGDLLNCRPASRRAWIEMQMGHTDIYCTESRPASRRAWIEMMY